MAEKQYRKPFSIYKPLKKDDAGAGLQMKWSSDAECIFVEMARQKGPKLPIGDKNQFDWGNKITFKLGLIDIGQLLLVGSKKSKVDLVHKSARDGVERIASMSLEKQTGDYDNYKLSMSKKETKNGNPEGEPVRVTIYIDHHEMQLVGIMLRRAVEKMLGL